MWETVATKIKARGGTIKLGHKAVSIRLSNNSVKMVKCRNKHDQRTETIIADYVISTMPVRSLINSITPPPPAGVIKVARGLQYRDFITVGLLLQKLKKNKGSIAGSELNLVPDNWIYIQDNEVKVGRIQIFNNWSPFLIADLTKVWIGMEYFCRKGDDFWSMTDPELCNIAISELGKIGLAEQKDLLDSVVIRVPKAYPGYFGSYDKFSVIRKYTDNIPNLFLIGRNGMHRYNNQDHSMLTARYAAEAIINATSNKDKIWNVNIDDDYHEE